MSGQDEAPQVLDHLRHDCVCAWTSTGGEPGWTLTARRGNCPSPVHQDPA